MTSIIDGCAVNDPAWGTQLLRGLGFRWSPWRIGGATVNNTVRIYSPIKQALDQDPTDFFIADMCRN